MCLIVVKPAGKPMPKKKLLKQWFKDHDDGFGLAFPQGQQIRILKGGMNEQEMFKLLKRMKRALKPLSPEHVNIILHFRQATAGSITPENCHPFPITRNQADFVSLDLLTECALAHNGVIYDYYDYHFKTKTLATTVAGNKTDTQQFIEDYLVDLGDALWQPAVQHLIEAASMSKFALLTENGVTLIGEFIKADGYWYSNSGYKPTVSLAYALGYYDSAYFAQDESYLGYLKTQNQAGGIVCDNCQRPRAVVYEASQQDGGLLCHDCYRFILGKEPTEEEGLIY